MADYEDFDWDEYEETDWDSVEGVTVYFDEDGNADVDFLIDGEIVHMGTVDSSEVRDLIWDDLYWHCEDEGIEFDAEEDY